MAWKTRAVTLLYRYPYRFFALVALAAVAIYLLIPADIEARDERGRTALYLAAERGDLETVEGLLARGAQVDAMDDCRWTPMMKAAQNGHRDVAAVLLQHGANVDARDKGGYPAVMVAAGDNRAEVVRLLTAHGARLDVRDDTMGWSALIWAAKEGYRESVAALLAAGADPRQVDFSGRNAIEWARESGHDAIAAQLEAAAPRGGGPNPEP